MLAFLACEPIDNMDSIEVLQEPKTIDVPPAPSPSLSVSPTSFDIAAEGGKVTAVIESNCDWTISSNAAWCHLSATEGTGGYSLEITVDENTTVESRTATINIQYDNSKAASITIPQQGIVDPHRDPDGGDNNPPSW